MMRTLWYVAALALASTAALADERTFERTVPAEAAGVVEISNVAGSVDVIGWDRNEVEVKGELEEGVELVDVRSSGGRTIVKVVLPQHSSHDVEANLVVRVPRKSELNVSLVSADLSSREMSGKQRLRTVSGDVKAELPSGDFDAKTVSGDVTLRGHEHVANMRISTVSGDVRLERGAGAVDATTVSGDLVLQVNPASDVRVRTTSGSLDFQGRLQNGAALDVETISGDLSLRAKSDEGFSYEISTFSGDIENCFDATVERTSKYGPGSQLNGVRKSHAAKVRAKTMSGDVNICDR